MLAPPTPRVANSYSSHARSAPAGPVTCYSSGDFGSAAMRLPPPDLGPVTAVAVGWLASCAILQADSTVRCWGSNIFGHLNIPCGIGPVKTMVANENGVSLYVSIACLTEASWSSSFPCLPQGFPRIFTWPRRHVCLLKCDTPRATFHYG